MKSPWLGALAAILSLAVAAPVFAQTGTAPAPAPAQVPGPDLPGAVAMLQLYNPSSKPTPNTLNAYLRVATTGTRAQTVYITANSYGFGAAPVREVFAFVEHVTGPLDPALMQRLITANDGQMPTGCWAVSTAADGSHYIVYESYIPNNASAELVQNEVTFVGKTADALEAELTGGQDVQ